MTGIVGSIKTGVGGTYNLYTVPAGKVFIGTAHVVSNSPESNVVKLFISPTTTPSAMHTIQYNTLNSLDNSYERKGLVLNAGEVFSVECTQADTNVILTGVVRDSSNLDLSTKTLLNGNATSTVFEILDTSIISVNLCLTLTGSSALSKSDVSVYVTPNTPVNGRLLFKGRLEADAITGFQKGSIYLSGGDKLVVVTTNTVGTLAARVSGFRKVIQ